MEVSAKGNINVKEIFNELANRLPRVKPARQDEQAVRLAAVSKADTTNSSWCC
jgi:hypothetical protein